MNDAQLIETRLSSEVVLTGSFLKARRDVVRAARDAGAAGFVRKGCGESEVIRAIRAVMAGRPVWPAQPGPCP